MKAPKSVESDAWNSLLAAARGEKGIPLKVKELLPIYYFLLGMKKEALHSIEVSIEQGGNWYFSLKLNPHWQTLSTEPDYTRVLEKAKVLHEKYTERFK